MNALETARFIEDLTAGSVVEATLPSRRPN